MIAKTIRLEKYIYSTLQIRAVFFGMVTGAKLTKMSKFSRVCVTFVTRVRLGSGLELRATSHGVITEFTQLNTFLNSISILCNTSNNEAK